MRRLKAQIKRELNNDEIGDIVETAFLIGKKRHVFNTIEDVFTHAAQNKAFKKEVVSYIETYIWIDE